MAPVVRPREVFERAQVFVRNYDLRYADCFAEDGVLVLPFAPPSMPRRTQGRAAIRALLEPRYRAGRASGRHIEYTGVTIHDTTDPEVIVVEFEAIGKNADGAIVYQLPFILVIRVRDGEIVEQRDYFDSLALESRLRIT
jgi:ketosteroid isomerase-like protein